MKMTLDQRASRLATRKNNRVQRKYPLLEKTGVLPDEWFTTTEEQKAYLREWDEYALKMRRKRERLKAYCDRCGEHLRLLVAKSVSYDTLRILDEKRQELPRGYGGEFWRSILTGRGWQRYIDQ